MTYNKLHMFKMCKMGSFTIGTFPSGLHHNLDHERGGPSPKCVFSFFEALPSHPLLAQAWATMDITIACFAFSTVSVNCITQHVLFFCIFHIKTDLTINVLRFIPSVVSVVYSHSLLTTVPPNGHTTIGLHIHLLMGIWVVSTLGFLWRKVL